jgi:hypothetical protein
MAARRRGSSAAEILARFRAKHAFGLDPGVGTGSRKANVKAQVLGLPFRRRDHETVERVTHLDLA